MGDHAIVSPQFWIGETGRFLKSCGPETQVVALYLLTCPNSNMIGLYYLPLPTLCHETGVSREGALKALQRASEGEFARYDAPSETVFVYEMARYQIGDTLKPGDNRIKAIQKMAIQMRKSPFYQAFLDRYRKPFLLEDMPKPGKNQSPSEAPSKPLRSQDQEQEQDQDKEKEPEQGDNGSSPEEPRDAGSSEQSSKDPPTPKQPPKKSSKHFSDLVGGYVESIRASCEGLEALFNAQGKDFNPYQWVQFQLKKQAHPQAIDESLAGLLVIAKKGEIKDLWGYCNAILKTKNQNVNEMMAMNEHSLTKQESAKAARMICEALGLEM